MLLIPTGYGVFLPLTGGTLSGALSLSDDLTLDYGKRVYVRATAGGTAKQALFVDHAKYQLFAGEDAGLNVATDSNIGIGWSCLKNNAGTWNVAVGRGALRSDGGVGGTGSGNVGIGDAAGSSITNGTHNFAMGRSALTALRTGSYNVAIGEYAGYECGAEARDNVFIGRRSGYMRASSATSVVECTAIGYLALDSSGSTASSNYASIAIGCRALYNSPYRLETVAAIGHQAGEAITAAPTQYSLWLGYRCGYQAPTGTPQLMIGQACPVTNSPLIAGVFPNTSLTVNATTITLAYSNAAGTAQTTTVNIANGASGSKVGFFGGTAVVLPASANQAAVTLGNADGEIGGVTINQASAGADTVDITTVPAKADVESLRDKCEELADDVRALSVLAHAIRAALIPTTGVGLIKGAA